MYITRAPEGAVDEQDGQDDAVPGAEPVLSSPRESVFGPAVQRPIQQPIQQPSYQRPTQNELDLDEYLRARLEK